MLESFATKSKALPRMSHASRAWFACLPRHRISRKAGCEISKATFQAWYDLQPLSHRAGPTYGAKWMPLGVERAVSEDRMKTLIVARDWPQVLKANSQAERRYILRLRQFSLALHTAESGTCACRRFRLAGPAKKPLILRFQTLWAPPGELGIELDATNLLSGHMLFILDCLWEWHSTARRVHTSKSV